MRGRQAVLGKVVRFVSSVSWHSAVTNGSALRIFTCLVVAGLFLLSGVCLRAALGRMGWVQMSWPWSYLPLSRKVVPTSIKMDFTSCYSGYFIRWEKPPLEQGFCSIVLLWMFTSSKKVGAGCAGVIEICDKVMGVCDRHSRFAPESFGFVAR